MRLQKTLMLTSAVIALVTGVGAALGLSRQVREAGTSPAQTESVGFVGGIVLLAIIFVSIVATIGGIQLFTEPLLFGSGVNAIAGGTTCQFQTVAMYLVQQAFTGQRFGYASTVAWVLFLIIAVFAVINVALLRRIKSVD